MPKKKGGGKKKSSSKKSNKTVETTAKDFYQPPPKTPEESLYEVLRRLRWWMEEESATIQMYLKKWDRDEWSLEDFTMTLRYLQAPISVNQTGLLIKYLDPSHSSCINMKTFQELHGKNDQELMRIAYTTSFIDPDEDKEDEGARGKGKKGKKKKGDDVEVKNVPIEGRGVPCSECGISRMDSQMEKDPRFVQVQLTLATFKDLQKHPAHFSILITSTTTIHGITQLIRTHLYEAVRTIAIFKEPSCSKESYLNPSWSLESCGIEGSSVKYEPTRYQLYYDYIPDFLDCPILMADNEMRHIPLKCLK